MSRRALLGRLMRGLLASGALVAAGPVRALAQVFQPYWVQTHTPTALWSGPDKTAVSFGTAPQWSYFQVAAPQIHSRLYVWSPHSQNYAYVDALAVGPVGAPPPEALAEPPTLWVATHLATMLWSGPDPEALPLGQVEPWSPFKVLETAGPRFRVRDPRTAGEVYLDATAVGPVEPPDGALPPPGQWWGTVGPSAANVRAAPTSEAELRGEVEPHTPVVVRRWLAGQEVLKDQPTWAQLADDVHVYSPLLRPAPIEQPPPPPPPQDAPLRGRWIDVNLTLQGAVAYEGAEPVYLARFSSGRPGWETSTGVFRIFRRVAKEIMDSSTLLGRDAARADYRIEDIKWTQYFTADGQAIHHNSWRNPALFGIPSSHGCLGLLERDARWLWDWASLGTPLVSHY